MAVHARHVELEEHHKGACKRRSLTIAPQDDRLRSLHTDTLRRYRSIPVRPCAIGARFKASPPNGSAPVTPACAQAG
jgi:hypothetical protein